MTHKTCPACGSDDITEHKIPHIVSEAFGGGQTIEITEDQCMVCDTTGDFLSKNDDLIIKAINDCKANVVKNILQDFSDSANMASIERALELPQRTLTKWKSGKSKPSAAGLALIKLIRIFPWLLDVAEKKFDYQEGQRIHLKKAIHVIIDQIGFNYGQQQGSTTQNIVFNKVVNNYYQTSLAYNSHHPQETIGSQQSSPIFNVK